MPDSKATPEEIEADIAKQRDALAATVTELQFKVQDKAKTTLKQAAIVGGAVAVLAVVVIVVKRRRS